jgi:GDP-fucose transporter C1
VFQPTLTFLARNKAVLNSSPDLPLTFLFIQLVIAVVLLHLSNAVNKRVEIPVVSLETSKKLIPVVLVNVIGLVFNTLCLRDVDASFFQVGYSVHVCTGRD